MSRPSLAYADAHYSHDVRLGSGTLLVAAGDTLPIPAWQARISGRYNLPVAAYTLGLEVDYDHASSYDALPAVPAFNADPEIAHAGATNLVGARVSLSRGAWRLTAFADNLLDSDDRLFRTHDSPFEQTLRDESFRPRTSGAGACLEYRSGRLRVASAPPTPKHRNMSRLNDGLRNRG